MDLHEGVKKGNVWKLESEAFKKPIEIKIWFENKELAEFRWMVNDLVERQWLYSWKLKDLWIRDDELQEWLNHYWELLEAFHWNLDKAWDQIDGQAKELKELYKVIADAKSVIELQSWTILHLQEQVKELEQKTSKQPTVIHDKWFISGHEASGLWMINLPDGDYLLIAKYVVWEHNEYVTNQDELIMDKIHVEWQHYVPFYKLEWGTELDVPTATIYYDLVFIPS